MSETETETETETVTKTETQTEIVSVEAPPVDNPPYVVPMGHADAPPPVPPEPVPDPETQAYIDAHAAPPDPRDPGQDPAIPPDDYLAGFVKPPDPRDQGTEDPAPGDLIPAAPGPDADAGEGGGVAPTAPPVNIDVPYLEQVSDMLACTMGNWEGEPTGYAYLWICDGLEVGTGTDLYTLDPVADVGREYACVVTAINDLGATTAPASNAVVIIDPDAF